MLSTNTLYYFFSTLAQVIAAATALIALLVHFRISALKDFLVGEGESILNMKNRYGDQRGYDLLTEKNRDRLEDAVDRKDIYGIKEIIKELSKLEENNNVSKDHHGFQWLFEHFEKTENQISDMSQTSKRAFFSALTTALYCIIAILFVEIVISCISYSIILIGLSIILLIICSYYIVKGIRLGFDNFTDRFR